jgi:hypothetical protein
MEPKGRQTLLLTLLAVVLLGVIVYNYWPRQAASGVPASNPQGGRAARGAAALNMQAPDVHLEALKAPRAEPGDTERNLFRFGARPAPAAPPPSASRPVARPTPMQPVVPAGPPPLPPIPLKFSAILTQGAERIAVLVDQYGHVIYGKEGGTVEGRYRILRIGVESIEMSYLDGQGRQTIRLNGQ